MEEILYDPIADTVQSGLLMDERHEVLPDGEFIPWLRRISGYPNLFLYRHHGTGNYVLAQWLSRTPRACAEIDIYPEHPDRIPRQIEGAQFWKLRLKTDAEVKASMAKKIREVRSEQRSARRETAEGRAERARYLKKRGFEVAAHLMEIGATPHIEEREAKNIGVHGAFDFLKPRKRISTKKRP